VCVPISFGSSETAEGLLGAQGGLYSLNLVTCLASYIHTYKHPYIHTYIHTYTHSMDP
jgi:hypothetical protein